MSGRHFACDSGASRDSGLESRLALGGAARGGGVSVLETDRHSVRRDQSRVLRSRRAPVPAPDRERGRRRPGERGSRADGRPACSSRSDLRPRRGRASLEPRRFRRARRRVDVPGAESRRRPRGPRDAPRSGAVAAGLARARAADRGVARAAPPGRDRVDPRARAPDRRSATRRTTCTGARGW